MTNFLENNLKIKYKISFIISLIFFILLCQSISFAVTDINTCTITVTGTYNYDSNAKRATYTIVDPGTGSSLTESIDYTKRYEDNIDAGNNTAKIVFIGRGDYSGTVTKTFTINKIDLNVTPLSEQSKMIGVPDPALKFTYAGNVDIEIPEFSGTLFRDAGETEGEYNIKKGSLAMVDHGLFKANNYNLVVDETVKFKIENRDAMILEFTVPANTSLIMPIPPKSENDYVIAWGDGSATYGTSEGFPEHTYDSAGTYTVRISGKVIVFGFLNDAEVDQTGVYKDYYSYCNYLTKIVTFGDIKAERLGFSKCKKLAGTIPQASGFTLLKSAENMFNGCEKLTGSIPTGFFKDLVGINSVKNTFKGCTLLAGSLEQTLFQGCTRIKSFESTFNGLINYNGSIPKDLFRDSTQANSFDSTFYGMTNIIGDIPGELFKSNPLVQSFSQTFGNCVKLANVSEDIFEQNNLATNYYRTFYNCKAFTEFPTAIFTDNRVRNISNDETIKNDYNGTFENCIGIPYVETDLYLIGYNMFAGCTAIEEVLLIHPAEIGINAFKNCNNLKTIMVGKEKLYKIGENAFMYSGNNPAKLLTYINSDNEILKDYDWTGNNRTLDVTPPKGTVEIVSPTYPYTNTRNVVLHIDVEDEVTDKSNIKIAILNDTMYVKETTGTLSNYRNAIAEYQARIDNPSTTEEERASLRETIEALTEKIRDIEIGKMPKDMLKWEPFVADKDWQLTAEDGIKTVYVYFMDEMGNISNFIQEF